LIIFFNSQFILICFISRSKLTKSLESKVDAVVFFIFFLMSSPKTLIFVLFVLGY